MLVNQGFCILTKKHEINIFYKNKLILFLVERYFGGSKVGGPVVKSEIFITMGMWEEKNYIYI